MKFFGKSPRSPNVSHSDRGGGMLGGGGGGGGSGGGGGGGGGSSGGQGGPGSSGAGSSSSGGLGSLSGSSLLMGLVGGGGSSSSGGGGGNDQGAGGGGAGHPNAGQSLAGPSSTSLQASQQGVQPNQSVRGSNPLGAGNAGFLQQPGVRGSTQNTITLVRSELSAGDDGNFRHKAGGSAGAGVPGGNQGPGASGGGGAGGQQGTGGAGSSSMLNNGGGGSSGISRRFSRRGRDGQEYSAYNPSDPAGRPQSMLSQAASSTYGAAAEVADEDNMFTVSLKRAATAAGGGGAAQPQTYHHPHPGLQVDGPPSGRPSMEHSVGLAVSREPSMMGPPSGQGSYSGIQSGVPPGSPMPPQTPQQQAYTGQVAPSYDPAKFEGQPMGRMTPPGSSRGNQQLNVDRAAGGGGQSSAQGAGGASAQNAGGSGGSGGGAAGQQQAVAVTPSHPPQQPVPGHPDYEILQQKYRKVKQLYFDNLSEIERLQNQIAQHRLSSYRSSLDDSEYTNRFDRLNGAIKNVSYEIRQSWISLPSWLAPHLPLSPGGREMTAVGRAAISRWVVDEIFEQYFHPALDPVLSFWLKNIEYNIRKQSPIPQSVQDDDDLNTKVSNWRLTTLDALQETLSAPRAIEQKKQLTEHLVEKLTSKLKSYLKDPPPPGLNAGVHMLVEIAIGLACHLPLESRAVKVFYPYPGQKFDAQTMKNEGTLPGPDKEKKEAKGGAGTGAGGAGGSGAIAGEGDGKEEKKDEDSCIRVAGFMAVEVRGRSILVKAPVWM